MPSEQSHPSNSSPARKGSAEQGQHLPITGGVRGLLGLPMREGGVVSTPPLTAPPRGHHYGQPPLPASEENAEGFREGAPDEGLSEEGGSAGADPQSDIPRSLLRHGATLPRAVPENPVDTRSTATTMPAEQREQTSFVIPGVSMHKAAFAALSHTADTTQVMQPEEAQESSSNKMTPLRAPVSFPHTRETAMFDSEFLSRLEHLVTEGAKAQNGSETQRPSVAARSPSPVEQMGVANEARGDTEVARRLTQLQRTVNELAATVSAQAAHMRDERQAQGRERQTPPQRTAVVQRVDASSTTPRAFWERSRLGRLHLRIGR
jgi:hypothetical protein